jgi:hypothetical protein
VLDLPAEEIEAKLGLTPKATGAVCDEDHLIGCKGFAYLARGSRPTTRTGCATSASSASASSPSRAASTPARTSRPTSSASRPSRLRRRRHRARFDEVLAGTDGKTVAEVDGGGRSSRTAAARRSSRGRRRRQLTIDRDLQWNAQKVLTDKLAEAEAESGSATIIDVQTGEVLALASCRRSTPRTRGGRRLRARQPRRHRRLRARQHRQGHHRRRRPRGGVLTPDSVLSVADNIQVANKRFTDSHDHPVEQMTFTGVLVESSNVGTIMAAQKVGGPKLHEMLERFGIGSQTGIELPAESPASCATSRTSGPRPTTAPTRSATATR